MLPELPTCFRILMLCLIFHSTVAQNSFNADSVEHIFDKLPDSIKIRQANNLMMHYMDVDLKKSQYYAEQAFALEGKVTNRNDIGMTYISWAIAQYNYGKYQQALHYNLKALDIYSSMGDSTKIGTTYNNIGITYNAIGDYATAAYYSFLALEIHSAKKNWRKAAISSLNISSSYYEAKDFEATLTWARKGYDYYQRANEPDQYGYALQMFIDAQLDLGRIDSAKYYLEKVKAINKEFPNEYLETVNLSQQGMIYAKEKKYDSAIAVQERVIKFYSELEMDDAVLHTRISLAKIYLELNNVNDALKYATEAYASAWKIRNKVLIVESSLLMSDVLKQKREFPKALEYSATASVYKDSLMLESLRGSIAGRMADVKLEKETQAKLDAVTRSEQQSILIGKQTLIIIMIAVGLIGMIIIALTIRRVGLFRKKLNDELYQKNQQLSDLNEEINGLVNTIVHDLKSPLNSVQGILTVMSLSESNKTEKDELIALAKKSVANGHDIIRQLLELREVEENQSKLQTAPIDVHEFTEDVFKAYEVVAAQKSISFSFEASRTSFNSDKVLLRRILDNLVSNALKFSRTGTTVKLSAQSEGNSVVFRVSDEGPGFSADDLTKIYKKFQKLSARPTGGEGSNGLGLATVSLLVKRLGGVLDLQTNPGKGSTFIIKFSS